MSPYALSLIVCGFVGRKASRPSRNRSRSPSEPVLDALDRLRSRFEEATDALDQCDREHALAAGRRPTLLIYRAVCADEDTTGWPHEDLGNLRVVLNALVRVFRL